MIKDLKCKIKNLNNQIVLEEQKIGYLDVFERELLGLRWGELAEFDKKIFLDSVQCTVECNNTKSKFRTVKSEKSGDITVNTLVKNCVFTISRNLRVKGKLICYEHIDNDGCLIDWFETKIVDGNAKIFCKLKEYTTVLTPKLETMIEEYKELCIKLEELERGGYDE